jgi:hypothetical protein
MINAIGTSNINPIQMFNAVNAFKSSEQSKNTQVIEPSNGISINDSNILKTQNIDEIKQIAQNAGELNLSNEDIQYGITYGRSVIADYMI